MKIGLTCVALMVAGTAMAHVGVKNPAVKARMDSMSAIGDATKVLGEMAKGATPFDSAAAQAAAEQIAREAERTPELFRDREDDPKSEARAEIWDSFADFEAKSTALVMAAAGMGSVQSLDELRAGMAEIGGACNTCHKAYRE